MKKVISIVLMCLALSVCSFAEEVKENTLSLTIFERITVSNLLPNASNYVQGVVINDLRKKLILTQEEMDTYEVKALPGSTSVTWNDPDYEAELVITKLEAQVLKDVIKKLDREKKVIPTDRFLKMYEKIEDLK